MTRKPHEHPTLILCVVVSFPSRVMVSECHSVVCLTQVTEGRSSLSIHDIKVSGGKNVTKKRLEGFSSSDHE